MNYRIDRNNYHQKPKNSTIYTPPVVSQFIFELLRNKTAKGKTIFDPCSGTGNLLRPWKENGYQVWGNDNDPKLLEQRIPDSDLDFLTSERHRYRWPPSLILCNPPFNGMKPKLAPEVWLDKIIELFGKDIPIVLFAPIRLRLCSQKSSPRYQKWTNGTYPPISSIISLTTKDTFPQVDFFTEILIFNIPGLQPHYFYHET